MSDKPKTVRVRIAVAVNEKGHWNSAGFYKWAGDSEGEACSMALEGLDEPGMESIHWVEADIPLPESQTIQGEVVR